MNKYLTIKRVCEANGKQKQFNSKTTHKSKCVTERKNTRHGIRKKDIECFKLNKQNYYKN